MDYLPLDLKCPNCGSPEAHYITTLTDPDIDYARILIYECKCGRYLLLKRGANYFIEDWEDLETCLDKAREDLLEEVRTLAWEKRTEENLKKIERLIKLLSVWFERIYDPLHTVEGDNIDVILNPLGDEIRVEVWRKLAICPKNPCIRDPISLAEGEVYKVNNRIIFKTYFVEGELIEIKVLWFNVEEDNSTCLREILKHAFS